MSHLRLELLKNSQGSVGRRYVLGQFEHGLQALELTTASPPARRPVPKHTCDRRGPGKFKDLASFEGVKAYGFLKTRVNAYSQTIAVILFFRILRFQK